MEDLAFCSRDSEDGTIIVFMLRIFLARVVKQDAGLCSWLDHGERTPSLVYVTEGTVPFCAERVGEDDRCTSSCVGSLGLGVEFNVP